MSCSCDHCNINLQGEAEEHESFFKEHFWFFIIPAAILLGASIYLEFFTEEKLLSQILAFISIFLSGYGVASEALEDIKNKKITANQLMLIAGVASFFIFHGQEGATAVLLYAIAEYLEELTTDKSKESIRELLELAPDEALVKIGDKFEPVPSKDVPVGFTIGVKPGMKLPLDGIIVKGKAYLDESAITGESLPVFKKKGDEVFAASIVTDSFIEVETTKDCSHTVVAQIAESIQKALLNKSKREKFIEKFAKYYTPIILISALFVMIIPIFIFGLDFNTWFYRGLILLVVSCPCALTLSTPLSNINALTKLSREGILVRGNMYIEKVDDIEVFAFDKTGTLTEGNLKVFEILSFNKEEREVLTIAASLENLSEHPIAKSILKQSKKMGLELYDVNDFEVIKGRGITGVINGIDYYVGNQFFLEQLRYSLPIEKLAEIEDTGMISILVGTKKELLGIITIRDVLRISSPILINGLKKRGIKTVLLSGDKQGVCNTIGSCLDIDDVQGELLPDQKLEQIKELKNHYSGVAMVGDGINDAPALALADLGIAIGASATDLTIETADVIIINDDLKKILTYIDVSKKTNKIIKQNIWTSIIIKVSFAILTVIGLMTLWLAVGIGDMGVSLFVLANGIRVFRTKNQIEEINDETIDNEASMLVCNLCQTKNIIPQHHGRDMIINEGKLVCWKNMLSCEYLESCEEEIPLNCPQCNNSLEVH
jgi:Cd2+/Zn2+-exporting ATPase